MTFDEAMDYIAELEAEIASLRERVRQAEAARDQLRAALLTYGQHDGTCAIWTTDGAGNLIFDAHATDASCCCGFATACREESE